MDQNDQQAIRQLFSRLSDVARQAPPRDPEAEAFIHRQIADQPGAPYYMAQTIVVQEQALQMAERRIAELEARAAQPAGGLFGGLFGGGSRGSVPRTGPSANRGAAAPPPERQGGGFLAGAAQTAMGVAGGVLLGNAIAGMFSGGEASAAESGGGMDEGAEDPGAFDDGGDFGDFDMDF